jgi:DNA-binding CsgD family transcriptional regulator
VRNHLSTAYRKLGVHSRHEALQVAEERNLI